MNNLKHDMIRLLQREEVELTNLDYTPQYGGSKFEYKITGFFKLKAWKEREEIFSTDETDIWRENLKTWTLERA